MPRKPHFILFLTLTLASCDNRHASSPPDPVTPEWVEKSVLENYHGRDFHLFGRVFTSLGSTLPSTDFSVTTTKDSLDLRWNCLSYDPTADSGGHLIITGGQGKVSMSIGGQITPFGSKDNSATMAVAMATGISAGSAALVNALWTGEGTTLFPSKATLEVHGDTCLLAGTNAAGAAVVMTIKNFTHIVHIHEQTTKAAVISAQSKLNLDDDTIRKSLINLGMPATDQDIKAFKETLAKGLNRASTMPGPLVSDIELSEQPLSSSQRPKLPSTPITAPLPESHDVLILSDQVHLAVEQAKAAHGTGNLHQLMDATLAVANVEIRISKMQIENLDHQRDMNTGLEGIDVQGLKTLWTSLDQELRACSQPAGQPKPMPAPTPK